MLRVCATGEFSGGDKHGEGKMVYANKKEYSGGWMQNLQHGHGVETLETGVTHTGNFENGLYHGQGALEMTVNSVVEYCLKGVFETASLKTGTLRTREALYTGSLQGFKMHGQGKVCVMLSAVLCAIV